MAQIFNKKSLYKSEHSTFGGIIYENDFNTNFSKEKGINKSKGSSIAARIERDKRFDDQCRRQYEAKKHNKNNKILNGEKQK